MKKKLWVLGMAAVVGAGLLTAPQRAEAAVRCHSNGSACWANNPQACCSGNCDLAAAGDIAGKCRAVSDE